MRIMLLGLLFVAPWPNGLNAPFYTGALFAFSALLLLKILTASPVAGLLAAPRLYSFAAIFFAGVLIWAFLQSLAIWPDAIAHPAWAAIEKAPAPISANPGLTLDALMLLAAYGLIFAYTAREAADRRFARRILFVIGAAAALSALAGLFLLTEGDASLFGAAKRVYRGRLTGPFINANLFASYLALGLVILAGFAAPSLAAPREGLRGILWRVQTFLRAKASPLAGVVVIASALLLTGSRGGALAAFAGAGALAASDVAARIRARRGVAAPLIAVVVIAGIVAAASAGGVEKRMAQHSVFGSEGREEVYRLTGEMISERWLTGHGLGAYQDSIPIYYDETDMGLRKPFLYAHNIYAQAVVDLGAPAAALLFLSIGLVVAQCARGAFRRRSQDRVFPAIAFASAAALLAHGVVDDPLSMPTIAVSFAAVLGVGYARSVSHG